MKDKEKMLAGRPLIFKEPKELEKRIEGYFEYCDARTKKEIVKTKDYFEIIDMPDPIPYTVYGLADYLDVDADTLLNYQVRSEFSVLISRAKSKILTNKVQRGLDGKSNPQMTKLLLGHNYGIIEPKSENAAENKDVNINIIYPPTT
jgi:hypothetical protein